jgi:hypothetical protein
MFRRVALSGSAELFRITSQEAAAADRGQGGPEEIGSPPDGALHEDARYPVETYYRYSLTEPQVQTLIDALQKIKYPHNVKSNTRLSMEEFERLEALRQVLLDGLR